MSDGSLSFAAFARARGWSRSYVTALRKAGRLVLTADGKRVLPTESDARILATRDPAKAGVVARHAAARAVATANVAAQADHTTSAGTEAPAGPPTELVPGILPLAPAAEEGAGKGEDDESGFASWKAATERERYRQLKRENELAEGKLVDAAEIRLAVAELGTALRQRLEALPNHIAALVEPNDRDTVRQAVTDTIEHTLKDLATAFGHHAEGASE